MTRLCCRDVNMVTTHLTEITDHLYEVKSHKYESVSNSELCCLN